MTAWYFCSLQRSAREINSYIRSKLGWENALTPAQSTGGLPKYYIGPVYAHDLPLCIAWYGKGAPRMKHMQ
jgi:hypothetical protein